jgi:hypothetical protein
MKDRVARRAEIKFSSNKIGDVIGAIESIARKSLPDIAQAVQAQALGSFRVAAWVRAANRRR